VEKEKQKNMYSRECEVKKKSFVSIVVGGGRRVRQ